MLASLPKSWYVPLKPFAQIQSNVISALYVLYTLLPYHSKIMRHSKLTEFIICTILFRNLVGGTRCM